MAYREDKDLNFLSEISSKDLQDLVDCLIKDNDGKLRMTEELTNTALYKTESPNHAKYWREIAAEVQCFGANSLVTMLRGGKGVAYREVLIDVCDKANVKYDAKGDTPSIEVSLLSNILKGALDKMTEVERAEFAKIIGFANLKSFTPASIATALQVVFRAGGFKSYQLTLIIANAVSRAILGRGLALAGNAALMRTASLLAGPVGWALTGAWTVADIAGPAYRVTMPAVIQVALLRTKHSAELAGFKREIDEEMSRD